MIKTRPIALLAVLLMLSTMMEQAFAGMNITDIIGLVVVTNGGRAVKDPDKCSEGSAKHDAIQAQLNAGVEQVIAAAAAAAGGPPGRALLGTYYSWRTCTYFCRCWPTGQCYLGVPYGECKGWRNRGLEDTTIEQEDTATSLRGGGRALQTTTTTIPQILGTGFWEGYDHKHPQAHTHCAYLLEAIQPTLKEIIAVAGKAGCKEQFSKKMLVGCVNLAAL